jgi:hypothetical protein
MPVWGDGARHFLQRGAKGRDRLLKTIQIVHDSGGEGLSKEQLATVLQMSVAEFLTRAEEREQGAEQARLAARLFDGLPKGITFEEACSTKAAQGSEFAQKSLAAMASREHRVFEALFDAAVDLHPRWRQLKKERRYAPDCRALVEWFQTTHSHEARNIEDSIE